MDKTSPPFQYKYNNDLDPPAPEAQLKVSSELLNIIGKSTDDVAPVDQNMILDTGAEISVLPSKTIAQIEQALGVKLPYTFRSVESFDGRIIRSKQYKLQVYRGSYLCFDEKTDLSIIVGSKAILGRDFINQYAIVLDGPKHTWKCLPHDQQAS